MDNLVFSFNYTGQYASIKIAVKKIQVVESVWNMSDIL